MKGTLEEIFEKRAECSPTNRGLNDIIIIESNYSPVMRSW